MVDQASHPIYQQTQSNTLLTAQSQYDCSSTPVRFASERVWTTYSCLWVSSSPGSTCLLHSDTLSRCTYQRQIGYLRTSVSLCYEYGEMMGQIVTSLEYLSKHTGSSRSIQPLNSSRQSWNPCRSAHLNSRKSHQKTQTQVSVWASRLLWSWCSSPSSYMARSGTHRCRTRSRCRRSRTRCSRAQIWPGTQPNGSGCRRARWCCKGWALRRRCLLGSCPGRRSLLQYRSCWRMSLENPLDWIRMPSKHTSHQCHSSLPTDFQCRYSKSSVGHRTSRLWIPEPHFRVLSPWSDMRPLQIDVVGILTQGDAVFISWDKVGAIGTDAWVAFHEVVQGDVVLRENAGTRAPDVGWHTQTASSIARRLSTEQCGIRSELVLWFYRTKPNAGQYGSGRHATQEQKYRARKTHCGVCYLLRFSKSL